MIRIVKASAGSGKTFTLAKTYISLLLRSGERYPYRHCLAVTFTNKATDEMKSRILKELDLLAREPEKSGYFKEFSVMLGSGAEVQKRAERLLFDILHDYSAFAVSTIDRFFQQTLKAFAREIGQFSSYQVELDKDSLVRESVDRILDSLSEDDPKLLGWITDSVVEQLEAGGRFNLENRLYDTAGMLKSDEHRTIMEELGLDEEKIYSKDNLRRIGAGCARISADFRRDVSAAAGEILHVLGEAGVDPDDSNRKFLGRLHVNAGLGKNDDILVPTESWLKNASDENLWFSKSKAPSLLPKVSGVLEAPLARYCSLFGHRYKVYRTAEIISSQLYNLGIASELYREFNAILKEKNVLSIDDSNLTLKKIIDGSDAPFVYEKIGVRFEDFLLDEFQDTSAIQWDNFRPLLAESHSSGHENLIVGDIKQSIYRWRGSDWNLLASRVKDSFPDASDSESLSRNWRSLRNIVEFNNGFFPYAARMLDRQFGEGDEISRIYSDVAQEVMLKDAPGGSVKFTFCDGEAVMPGILDSIGEVRAAGAGYGQIAILVRNNSSGSDVASYLVDRGIPVISDDSLRVKASVTVRRVVALMSFADNPEDKINAFLADSIDAEVPSGYRSIADLAETFLRKLARMDKDVFEGEVLHIQSFMDELSDWAAINGNNLPGFLSYWKDADPKISSPDSSDAVRIITIHKSKGLEFPYVIFPFAETVGLYRSSCRWSCPEVSGTPLEGVAEGAYQVLLSEKTSETLFGKDYRKEQLLQYIDNINTFYVAMTRAGKGMHVIAAMPSASGKEAAGAGKGWKDFSQILYAYVSGSGDGLESAGVEGLSREAELSRASEEAGAVNGFDRKVERDEDGEVAAEIYSKGEIYDFEASGRCGAGREADATAIEAGYPSYPLNPEGSSLGNSFFEDPSSGGSGKEDVRERGRLKFSSDSIEFFSAPDKAGMEQSPRLKGIVLHNILASVSVPSDIEKAVGAAVARGDIEPSRAAFYTAWLSERIEGAVKRGWFPEDAREVLNETAVISPDGEIHRPDRVVISGGRVMIIDYKFGEKRRKYASQLSLYASLYRSMGYGNVSAYLWYVPENEVEEIK